MDSDRNSLVEVLEYLREKQFIYDFNIQDNLLLCNETDEIFKAEEVIIEKIYRFKGVESTDENSVLYAITANSGTQGVLIEAYNTQVSSELSEFTKNVPVKTEFENKEISL